MKLLTFLTRTAWRSESCLAYTDSHRIMGATKSGISYVVLPDEYMFVNRTAELPTLLIGRVRVIHGLTADCEPINRSILPRLYDSLVGSVFHYYQNNSLLYTHSTSTQWKEYKMRALWG